MTREARTLCILVGALALSGVWNVTMCTRRLLQSAVRSSLNREGSGIPPDVPHEASSTVGLELRSGPTSVDAGALAQCRKRLLVLEEQAAELSAELRRLLPAPDVFQLGSRNAAGEALVQSILESSFADAGIGLDYTVECHDVVCRVTFVTQLDAGEHPEVGVLQGDQRLRAKVDQISFRAAKTARDLGSNAPVSQEMVYLKLHGP